MCVCVTKDYFGQERKKKSIGLEYLVFCYICLNIDDFKIKYSYADMFIELLFINDNYGDKQSCIRGISAIQEEKSEIKFINKTLEIC